MRLAEKLNVADKDKTFFESAIAWIELHKNKHCENKIQWGVPKEQRTETFASGRTVDKRSFDEVQAYYKGLDFIAKPGFKLSEDCIKELHKIVVEHTPGRCYPGKYKPYNHIIAFAPKTDKNDVKKEYSNLISWTNNEIKKGTIHPLLIAGLFFYEHLNIHPFADGNGRTGRILFVYLLLNTGYEFVRYASFEKTLQLFKLQYFKALIEDQKGVVNKNDVVCKFQVFLFFVLVEMIKRIK